MTKIHTILLSEEIRVVLAVLIVLGVLQTLREVWEVWKIDPQHQKAGQLLRKSLLSVAICQIPALFLIYYAWFHADAVVGQKLLKNAEKGFIDDLHQAVRDIEQQEHWSCPLTNVNVAVEAVKNSRKFLQESCISFADEIRRTEQACAGTGIESHAASLHAFRKDVEDSLIQPLRDEKKDGQHLCVLRQKTLDTLNGIIRSR